jgi:hypothetical protein
MGRVCSSQCGRIKMHVRFLVGNPEGKKPLGRTRCKWKDNITVYLKDIQICRHWVHVAWSGTSGNTFVVNTKLNSDSFHQQMHPLLNI